MWTLWLFAALIVAAFGLGIKFALDYFRVEVRLTWIEFAAVMAVLGLVVIPLTVKEGLHLAKASKLTYHEFWGGYETAAQKDVVPCQRDGHCRVTYNCDPYTVTTVVTNADGKGTHVETHTEYHSCPYATVENWYTIKTTLGSYDLGLSFNEGDPGFRGDPPPSNIRRGDPPMWTAASKRIAAGDPGPVTADKTYDNYILASTRTILHKYSDAVDKFRKAGILPDPVRNLNRPIHDYYYADKMTFVGMTADDDAAWQFALAQFNAALGSDLQGDMHVVAVDASMITNPDEYSGALSAWWQDKALKRRALSKNGIGLVLGVQMGKIVWARSFTGMPVGNDGLNLDIQTALTGTKFTPAIFGHPTAAITGKKADVKLSGSPLEDAVWGPHKFVRVCMTCKDKTDSGTGYKYLGNEIQPTAGQKALIVLVTVLIALLLFGIAAIYASKGESRARSIW